MNQDPTKNEAFERALGQADPNPGDTTFASTNDRRVGNNPTTGRTSGAIAGGAFRAKYRQLSDAEKDLVDRIKGMGEDMYRLLAEAGGTDPYSDKLGSPELTLAFRGLEQAVMMSVKHVTK